MSWPSTCSDLSRNLTVRTTTKPCTSVSVTKRGMLCYRRGTLTRIWRRLSQHHSSPSHQPTRATCLSQPWLPLHRSSLIGRATLSLELGCAMALTGSGRRGWNSLPLHLWWNRSKWSLLWLGHSSSGLLWTGGVYDCHELCLQWLMIAFSWDYIFIWAFSGNLICLPLCHFLGWVNHFWVSVFIGVLLI
jgi:hypothetical protein